MADSKRKKEVKQKENPSGKFIAQGGNPERYYSENPAWAFANSDQEMWAFSQGHIGETFWTEIFRGEYRAGDIQGYSLLRHAIKKTKRKGTSASGSAL